MLLSKDIVGIIKVLIIFIYYKYGWEKSWNRFWNSLKHFRTTYFSDRHFLAHHDPAHTHMLYILLPLFDINAKGVFYMVIPKCDKKLECTFRINAIVLSQFSCNTLLVCNAICTSTNNSIMWSVMENFSLE